MTLHDRSPFITVEMQFRPPVPSELRPYFWGAGMLSFYDAEHRKVREFDLTKLPGPHSTQARNTWMRVRDVDGFGVGARHRAEPRAGEGAARQARVAARHRRPREADT